MRGKLFFGGLISVYRLCELSDIDFWCCYSAQVVHINLFTVVVHKFIKPVDPFEAC